MSTVEAALVQMGGGAHLCLASYPPDAGANTPRSIPISDDDAATNSSVKNRLADIYVIN